MGSLPRTDLVIQDNRTGECLAGLEIKLTALPDNTTCDVDDKYYGSEIVVRPDTIGYLACSIAERLGNSLEKGLGKPIDIADWPEPAEVLFAVNKIISKHKKSRLRARRISIPIFITANMENGGKVT